MRAPLGALARSDGQHGYGFVSIASVRNFLKRQLQLKVNLEKSAVARPWERKFLGYSMTFHIQPRLKVARQSVKRIREKLKESFRRGKGRRLDRFIEQELNPILRGLGKLLPTGRGLRERLES